MREAYSLVWSVLVLLFRSRVSLEAEILILRHQLDIQRRHVPKRVAFSAMDRLIFVGLYRLVPNTIKALTIVKPGTVIRWQSRTRKFEQVDKWSFCLTTAIIAANRRDHEQTTPPEPHTGLQGEGGACRRQGRSNAGAAGRAIRRPPQSDHIVEGRARGRGCRCFRCRRQRSGAGGHRREVAARQDRR